MLYRQSRRPEISSLSLTSSVAIANKRKKIPSHLSIGSKRALLDVVASMSSSCKLTPADGRNFLLNAATSPLTEGAVIETACASLMVTEVCEVATIFASQAEAVRTRTIECIHSPIDPVQHVYTGEKCLKNSNLK